MIKIDRQESIERIVNHIIDVRNKWEEMEKSNITNSEAYDKLSNREMDLLEGADLMGVYDEVIEKLKNYK